MNAKTVEERIAEIAGGDPESLRREYEALTGARAGTFGAGFMACRCAYRVQEMGGLTAEEKATLLHIAGRDPKVNRSLRDAPRSSNETRGVIYRREYRGRVYAMKALGDGRYEYESKIYTSPTVVVRAITGKSHYNGVLWWGLRTRPGAGRRGA